MSMPHDEHGMDPFRATLDSVIDRTILDCRFGRRRQNAILLSHNNPWDRSGPT